MQIIANGLLAGSICALSALGFAIIFHVAKFFDFSFAATLTASAYCAGIVADKFSVPLLMIILVGCLSGMSFGFMFEYVAYRRLRDVASSPLTMLLSSFGLMVAVLNLISLMFGDGPRPLGTTFYTQGINIGSARLTNLQIGTIVTSVVLAVICWWLLKHTRFGLAVRAVSNDVDLAECSGLNTKRIVLAAIVVSSGLAGVTSTLVGLDVGLTPSLGIHLLFPAVVAVVVGGAGRIAGATISAFLIGVIQQCAGWFVSTAWEEGVVFLILLIFLVLSPRALLGNPHRKASV